MYVQISKFLVGISEAQEEGTYDICQLFCSEKFSSDSSAG
jgi:hypothetical protein